MCIFFAQRSGVIRGAKKLTFLHFEIYFYFTLLYFLPKQSKMVVNEWQVSIKPIRVAMFLWEKSFQATNPY